uniref:ATP synthase F0 subunit 8 n=1 Tax=Sahlbergotettix salicicola TaxID=2937677 RepID=A0A9E9FUZ3_9HEMI|nr:ATP synthase F0 subunit 8 [Sahlbergotettix salicicola]WAP91674.1 ATP synthase F0 subunit 8 [Sahlbergotettix salicicola]
MPQMSPIWWLTLMLTFNMSYLMMNTILYFNYMNKNKNSIKMIKSKLIWKW